MWLLPKTIQINTETKKLELFETSGSNANLKMFSLDLRVQNSNSLLLKNSPQTTSVYVDSLVPNAQLFIFELDNYWTVLSSSFKQIFKISDIDDGVYIWLNEKTYVFSITENLSSVEFERKITTNLTNYTELLPVNEIVNHIDIGGLSIGFQQTAIDLPIKLEIDQLNNSCLPKLNTNVNIYLQKFVTTFNRKSLVFSLPNTIDIASVFLYKNKNYFLDNSLNANSLINIKLNRFIIFL